MAKPRAEVVVIGLGRFGSSLALQLLELGHSVLGVDCRSEVSQAVAVDLPQVCTLDATNEEALAALGLEEFQTAVVTIGEDFESNVLVTASLKQMGIPQVVSKARNQRQKEVLLKIGADQVVLPEHDAGVRLAHQLSIGDRVIDRMELGQGISVTELSCPPGLADRSLAELNLRARHGVTVLAVKGKRLLPHPGADDVLLAGDVLVVMGTDRDIAKLAQLKN